MFLDDEWSLWHINVWLTSRETNGFGVQINADIVFRYTDKHGMDPIDTIELIKKIERGAANEQAAKDHTSR